MAIRFGDIIEVKTERLAYGGDAIARYGNLVIFIPFAAPHEVVRVRVTSVKKTFARAVMEQVVVASPNRITPPCRLFGDCGGCQLQHIEYEAQLKAKSDFIRDSLARIGHIDWPNEIELIASPEFGYRSRAQVKVQYVPDWRREGNAGRSEPGSVHSKALVGFNKHASHGICDVEECPILERQLSSALGELRRVVASESSARSERLPPEIEMASGDSTTSFDPQVGNLSGGPVSRTVDGLVYKFTPRVFFQANRFLIERLVNEAVGHAGGDLAIDLYCGVGLFAGHLTRRYREVVGVESDRDAATFALANMAANGLTSVRTINDSAEDFARDYLEQMRNNSAATPDVVLLDPPRAGAAEVIPYLVQIGPTRVTYVSCDPTTLARDLRRLLDCGYVLTAVTGLDLFPQTYHVETVCHLEKR